MMMRRLHAFFLAVALAVPFSSALAQGFPTAPPNIKEAQALGLQRLTAEELKAFFPGVIKSKGPTGQHIWIYGADGSIDRKGFKGDKPGTWRIDESKGALCNSFSRKQGPVEACLAVFRAPDGMHHFDYDLRDGFYAHTWRRDSAE